jgi:hypothetical protein
MFRLLRRFQPKFVPLAVLYWMALTIVALVVLFVAFYYLDGFLPGGGMF